jgi:hypothetical protein
MMQWRCISRSFASVDVPMIMVTIGDDDRCNCCADQKGDMTILVHHEYMWGGRRPHA